MKFTLFKILYNVLEPDEVEPLPDIDESLEVNEEQINQSNEKKQEALTALVDKDYNKSAELYSEAIKLNPGKCFFTLHQDKNCLYL